MRWIILLATFAFCLTGQDLVTFPTLEASNLNKQKLQFPQGLAGKHNLVLLGFLREHQDDIDTWLAPLPALSDRHPDLAYYELPVIGRTNFLLRWVIDTGMRSGIPDKQQRARTITIYSDKKKFLSELQIESEKTIYALVIDKTGKVLWRAEGKADAAKLDSLEAFLNAL